MPITRPYRRTCRPFVNGTYSDGGCWQYVLHPKFSIAPEHYIRAFLMLQSDMQAMFDYVEPSDTNLACYSFRIHALLLRACIEVEANCRAILKENGYSKGGDWSMGDFKKIEASHRLSKFQVRLPVWQGADSLRTPFAAWATGDSPAWYKAYNASKHDRHHSFDQATLRHMTDAICGLQVILAAQFYTHDFSPADWGLSVGGPNDGMESAIGGYLRINFPTDWPEAERYDFKWKSMKSDTDPFQNYQYPL